MIFATYQCSDWETYKNNRYSELKKLLGISQEENIYWCFPANSVEQMVVNSFTVEPNQPAKFIIFETDSFYKIDKIKWNRYVELMDKGAEITEDLLRIDHADAAEYIVTKIPEQRFSCFIDLHDIGKYLDALTKEKESLTQSDLRLRAAYGFVQIAIDGQMSEQYLEMAHKLLDMVDFVTNDGSDFPEALGKMRIYKMALDSTILPALYLLGVAFGTSVNELNTVKWTALDIKTAATLHNESANLCIESPNLTNEQAYTRLKHLYEKIHRAMFSGKKEFAEKPAPNQTCPCGSGKKYKKCCGRPQEIDIVKIMTEGITEC